MLACIPTEGATGLDERLHGHFGSAPFFTLVDLDSGAVTVLPNSKDPDEHGQCRPLDRLADHGIDCMIVGGMGRRAVAALDQAGIRVYRAEDATVRGVMNALRAGLLPMMDAASACQGHGHGAGQGGCVR